MQSIYRHKERKGHAGSLMTIPGRLCSSHKLLLVMAAISFSLNSCKKFVQIDAPVTRLVTTSVFNNAATATAAQLAIYKKMAGTTTGNESYFMSADCGILADELNTASSNILYIQFYTNSLASNQNYSFWPNYYNYIYQANSIIENLQGNTSITASVAQQLIGESKFIRAFCHFYLANLYGDVPLVTTTDYRITGNLRRAARADVYRQVIADLNDAQNLLNTKYVNETDTAETSEKIRPNKIAAQALLARVYLYTNKYDSAEMMATKVINDSRYSLCTNLSGTNSVFLKNSTEAIWQFQTVLPANGNTADGFNFILTSPPSIGSNKSFTVNDKLLASFEAGDKRKTNWIGVITTATAPPVSYFFPYKYHVGQTASISDPSAISEYEMILRLAEQYLIRAEARAQQNRLDDAMSDLNVIRNRAGLLPLSSLNQTQVLTAVLQERRVELFCEWGHRWFDLNRTGNTPTVMGAPGNAYHDKGGLGAWDVNKQLFPVPQSEIMNDANLIQNPGY